MASGSKIEYLRQINKIVLAAGHGEGDPGAVNGQFKESDQTIYLVDSIYQQLLKSGVDVQIVPHNLGLQNTINWINARYKTPTSAWVIEIHRDWNAPNINKHRADSQMGVYYYGDVNGDNNNSDDDVISRSIADALVGVFLRLGTYAGTQNIRDYDGAWSKDHYVESQKYHLGFVHNTTPLAHLIECGFMSGMNSKEHLDYLASVVGQTIYEVFTGQQLPTTPLPVQPPVVVTPPSAPQPQPLPQPQVITKEVIKEVIPPAYLTFEQNINSFKSELTQTTQELAKQEDLKNDIEVVNIQQFGTNLDFKNMFLAVKRLLVNLTNRKNALISEQRNLLMLEQDNRAKDLKLLTESTQKSLEEKQAEIRLLQLQVKSNPNTITQVITKLPSGVATKLLPWSESLQRKILSFLTFGLSLGGFNTLVPFEAVSELSKIIASALVMLTVEIILYLLDNKA